MKVLVIAETKKSELKKASLELCEAAKGQEVVGLVFGSASESAAKELAEAGVTEVFWVKAEAFDNYHPEAYAAAATKVIEEQKPELVLASASSSGKDLLPKLAARSDAPLVTDCISADLNSRKFKKPYFAGKAIADIALESASIAFVSMRPNSLTAGTTGASSGKVTELAADFDFGSSPIEFVGRTESQSERPDLTEANIIVSGGRSLKTRENFKIIFDCADAFGGAAGASRAAVDEGLADHDMQVGQTGKTVNPSLYVACGISGAIQHLAGMRTSKVIVAINKDENAPIFSKADYGIVGDLFEVVPLLTEEAKKLLGQAA